MSIRNRIALATLAMLAASTLAISAYAADNNQADTKAANQAQPNAVQPNANQPQPYRVNMAPAATQGATARSGHQNIDLFLIPCLINANNGEVTLANIAEQRGQSQDVKNFAQQMIKDHTAAAKQFEQLQSQMTGAMHPQSPTNTPVAAALFEVNQQIDQACLASAQRELEQESGAEFDRCYIGMQVGMHMHLIDVLGVLKDRATSPEFKKAVEEVSQVANRHLDEAKKIAKDLEQAGSPRK